MGTAWTGRTFRHVSGIDRYAMSPTGCDEPCDGTATHGRSEQRGSKMRQFSRLVDTGPAERRSQQPKQQRGLHLLSLPHTQRAMGVPAATRVESGVSAIHRSGILLERDNPLTFQADRRWRSSSPGNAGTSSIGGPLTSR